MIESGYQIPAEVEARFPDAYESMDRLGFDASQKDLLRGLLQKQFSQNPYIFDDMRDNDDPFYLLDVAFTRVPGHELLKPGQRITKRTYFLGGDRSRRYTSYELVETPWRRLGQVGLDVEDETYINDWIHFQETHKRTLVEPYTQVDVNARGSGFNRDYIKTDEFGNFYEVIGKNGEKMACFYAMERGREKEEE